ncbi:helix-turn-helix transcriptional regulator [Lacticaseibacillus hulanensis]|uniref:helix-turn-helix transcriptional regulator n=1 Tax=Lacticaseibacillus hulanensis TaxID=2493111 RepID=UPI000FDAFEED|nr:AraC family transcriptional regulator [Lacticaseibacillus hulanensis]
MTQTPQNSDLSMAIKYNVGQTQVALSVADMYQRGYRETPHWHDDWEFFAPIVGGLHVFVNGRDYPVAEGTGLLVNSDRLHYAFTARRTDCRFVDLALNPDMLGQLKGTDISQLRRKMSLAAPDVVELTTTTPWQATILDRLHLLGNAYRFGGSDPLTVATEALAICTRVLPRIHVADEPMRGPIAGEQRAFQMVDFIQQHYFEPLTASQIAASVHISRSQCFNLFQEVLHTGPNAYLQQVRLERAAAELRTTRKSVAEIAQDCGFGTASHLIATFKGVMGVTPRKYRVANG